MEDEEKGIKLKLGVEEEGSITFLDVKLERGKKNGKVKTEWYQNEGNAGIFCNRRSYIDESTKWNSYEHWKKDREINDRRGGEKIIEITTRLQLKMNGNGKKEERRLRKKVKKKVKRKEE